MKVKLVRKVKAPSRGTSVSAGLDFYVPDDFKATKVWPGKAVLIPAGIKAQVPEGYALIAFNKSGIATKEGLVVGACVVDEDYEGEIHIHMINVGDKVVDIIPGSVTAGGGEIPTTTYLLRVEELFKGTADIVKDDVQIIQVQMVGSLKEIPAQGDYQRFSVFRDVPRLEMRHDYLLFTTQSSAVGLSTTVGLGQGAFKIFARNKEDFAVNEFNNAGLGLEASGPVAYSELAAKIRTLIGY